MDALLALEDGRTFACRSFTGPGEAMGEVVFNTSMTGYQEVLTDPSYSGQMVVIRPIPVISGRRQPWPIT